MRPGHTLSILLAAALGCQAAPPPDTTAEAKKAIDAADANWARLTATGHADRLADLYHANGVMLPPNMPPVHGRDAIRGFMTTMNSMSSPPPVLTFPPGVYRLSVWSRYGAVLPEATVMSPRAVTVYTCPPTNATPVRVNVLVVESGRRAARS